jgi:two-component system, oxyanion-binding sensor
MSTSKKQIRIGYAPLNDAAPLVMAHELGLFGELGLDVRLEKQSSWATARDLVRIGALDAAHMLAPIVIGDRNHDGDPTMFTPLVLSLCGNSIVVSRSLFQALVAKEPLAGQDIWATARALAAVAIQRRQAGEALLRFGVVFRQSHHLFDLRRLLIAGGADPDQDVSLAVVPPQDTERFLEQGLLDGFSAGEPWGSYAVMRGFGVIIASGHALWPGRIDKVLAFANGFDVDHLEVVLGIVKATLLAAQWLDAPGNRRAAAGMLVDGGYIDLPVDVVARGLTGHIDRGGGLGPVQQADYVVFERHGATFPWHSQGLWIADTLTALGTLEKEGQKGFVERAFKTDIYRTAALDLGMDVPSSDSKAESCHHGTWKVETTRPDGRPGTPILMPPDARFEITHPQS